MKHHELKTERKHFQATIRGEKLFEVRYNDRGFQKGDLVTLKEIDNLMEFTGEEFHAIITYVLKDERFLRKGWCILQFARAVKMKMLEDGAKMSENTIVQKIKLYLEANRDLEVEDPSYKIAEVLLEDFIRNNFIPEKFSYSAEGGLCFVFHKGTQRMHLEIYNDGEIGYIVEDEAKRMTIGNRAISQSDVISEVGRFLCELAACPFCGSDAKTIQADNDLWYVSCDDGICPCELGNCGYDPRGISQGFYHTEKEAIEAWNTRK